MGLPEITFHFPLQPGRERELFNRAVEILRNYESFQRFHWSLVEETGFGTFVDFLQEKLPGSELVTIPRDIMHGDIGFNRSLRVDDYKEIDREKLLKLIMESGVRPNKRIFDFDFRFLKLECERCGVSVNAEELRKESIKAFSRYLTFCSEEEENA